MKFQNIRAFLSKSKKKDDELSKELTRVVTVGDYAKLEQLLCTQYLYILH